jgi:hypothetical protein
MRLAGVKKATIWNWLEAEAEITDTDVTTAAA